MSANTTTIQNELDLGLQLSTLKSQIDYYHALQDTNTVVLTNALEQLNVSMKSNVDTEAMESWEKVIGAVSEVAYARATYNFRLAKFFDTCSDDEFLKFIAQILDITTSELQRKLKFFDDILSFKQSTKKGCLADFEFYLSVKKLIRDKPHNQELIDELHYIFYSKHEYRKKIDKIKGISDNKHSQEFLEPIFLEECCNLLSQFISQAELDLVKDTTFIVIGNRRPDDSYLSGATLELSEEVSNFLSKTLALMEKNTHFKELFESDMNRLTQALNIARNEIGYDKNYFLAYHTIHDPWYDALAAREKIEQEFHFLTKKRNHKKKNVETNLVLEEKTISTVIPSVCIEESERVASVVGIEPLKEAIADQYQLRTKEFKELVMKKRAEKDALKAQKKEQENKYIQERKEVTAKLLVKETEKKRETAFHLLERLTSQRLHLVEFMFQDPTPHNQIRYEEIESLFGMAEEGKIPGSITAVGSGSHRKICIQNTIGFFDQCSIDENRSESSSSTGGIFKPHGNQHTGKVPRIVVEMVRATLERVGITVENIALFRNSHQLKSQNNEAKI